MVEEGLSREDISLIMQEGDTFYSVFSPRFLTDLMKLWERENGSRLDAGHLILWPKIIKWFSFKYKIKRAEVKELLSLLSVQHSEILINHMGIRIVLPEKGVKTA